MSQYHSDTMNILTTNLKTLSDTMTSTFLMLQKPGLHPYHYGHYAQPSPYAPSPAHTMSISLISPVYQPIHQHVVPTQTARHLTFQQFSQCDNTGIGNPSVSAHASSSSSRVTQDYDSVPVHSPLLLMMMTSMQ